MVKARIPEVGERVEFVGRSASALPSGIRLEGEAGTVVEVEDHGDTGDGYAWIDVWVALQALQALHKNSRLHRNYKICTKITKGCLALSGSRG